MSGRCTIYIHVLGRVFKSEPLQNPHDCGARLLRHLAVVVVFPLALAGVAAVIRARDRREATNH